MKRKISRVVCFCLILSSMISFNSFAANLRPEYSHVPPAETELLPPNQKFSKDIKQEVIRGSLLSTCILNISNEGRGKIGILADTMAHVDVDSMYVTIYLDRLNEKTGKWENQKRYDYEFTPDDTPDGKLHAMLIDFNETRQPSGYYYRAWAYHEVEKNGEWEIMKTSTKGVLITDAP